MITLAGRLLVLYGVAHTLSALTLERAAVHAGSWFSGGLWGDDLANMSVDNSAYWLSVNSFGPPLTVIGLIVVWLDRRQITPPMFVAWMVGSWTAVDAVVSGLTPWPIPALATVLLVLGARRAGQRDLSRPVAGTPSVNHSDS